MELRVGRVDVGFGGRTCSGLGLFLLFSLGFGDFRFGGVERGGEEGGEEPSAEERIAKELPGLGPTGSADGEGLDPAEKPFGILGILEPGTGIGDEVEEEGTEQAAGGEFWGGAALFEGAAEEKQSGEGEIIDQAEQAEGLPMIIEHILEHIGEDQDGEAGSPVQSAREGPGAERDGVGEAEVQGHEVRPATEREHR